MPHSWVLWWVCWCTSWWLDTILKGKCKRSRGRRRKGSNFPMSRPTKMHELSSNTLDWQLLCCWVINKETFLFYTLTNTTYLLTRNPSIFNIEDIYFCATSSCISLKMIALVSVFFFSWISCKLFQALTVPFMLHVWLNKCISSRKSAQTKDGLAGEVLERRLVY